MECIHQFKVTEIIFKLQLSLSAACFKEPVQKIIMAAYTAS